MSTPEQSESGATTPAQRAIDITETDVGVADNRWGRAVKAVTSTGVYEPAVQPGSRSGVNRTVVAGVMRAHDADPAEEGTLSF